VPSASLAINGHSRFGIAQLSALIGAVGGGAVAARWATPEMFSAYSIGLAIFFLIHRFVGYKPVAEAMEAEIKKAN
jgi:hypothetical protein